MIKTIVGPSEIIKIAGAATPQQCSGWLRKVLTNSHRWVTRFPNIHSYGHAWYLDIEHGALHEYHANAEATNKLMAELPELLPILLRSANHMSGPNGETDLPCRSRAQNLGPYWVDAGLVLMDRGQEGVVHADYEGLAPYPAKMFDASTRAYSAVLTLAVAASGGNLKIWKARRLANEEPQLQETSSEVVEYAPGSLVIFDSFCYHQIMASQLNPEHPWRAVAAVHFLFKSEPYPHWEHWF